MAGRVGLYPILDTSRVAGFGAHLAAGHEVRCGTRNLVSRVGDSLGESPGDGFPESPENSPVDCPADCSADCGQNRGRNAGSDKSQFPSQKPQTNARGLSDDEHAATKAQKAPSG